MLNCLVNYGVVTRGRRPRLCRRTTGFLQIARFLDILQRPVCFLGELNGGGGGRRWHFRGATLIYSALMRGCLSACLSLYLDERIKPQQKFDPHARLSSSSSSSSSNFEIPAASVGTCTSERTRWRSLPPIPCDKKWPSRFNCLRGGIGHKRICRINKMAKKNGPE